MRILTWDNELAQLAQSYGNTCIDNHNPSAKTASYSKVGENLYFSWGTNDINIRSAVLAWYNEVTNPGFDPKEVPSFKGESEAGHYTQMIWALTDRIGCAITQEVIDSKISIVCNYYIAANMITDPVYLTGTACSKCSNG
jgi:hypothetical protein